MGRSKSYFIMATAALSIGCSQQASQETEPINSGVSRPPAQTGRSQTAHSDPKRACNIANPDTSLIGIKLRDEISAARVLRPGTGPDSNGQYHYYSQLDAETLTLTQHPGDAMLQISIFNVKYSDKADYGYSQLPVKSFSFEKGIKLGMSQAEIVQRLGECFERTEGAAGYTRLHYQIEAPADSKTNLLSRADMPTYYATYALRNGKLSEMEFGFEYP